MADIIYLLYYSAKWVSNGNIKLLGNFLLLNTIHTCNWKIIKKEGIVFNAKQSTCKQGDVNAQSLMSIRNVGIRGVSILSKIKDNILKMDVYYICSLK